MRLIVLAIYVRPKLVEDPDSCSALRLSECLPRKSSKWHSKSIAIIPLAVNQPFAKMLAMA